MMVNDPQYPGKNMQDPVQATGLRGDGLLNLSPSEIRTAIERGNPEYREADRRRPAGERMELVNTVLPQLCICGVEQVQLAEQVQSIVHRGMAMRQPFTGAPDDVGGQARFRADSMVFVGPSGVGKTLALSRLRNVVPQVISGGGTGVEHPITPEMSAVQIPWLAVRMTPGGTVRGFLHAISDAVQQLTGEDWGDPLSRAGQRSSTEWWIWEVKRVLSRYGVCLIVVDDVESMLGKSSHVDVDGLQALSDTWQIPFLFVGTKDLIGTVVRSDGLRRRSITLLEWPPYQPGPAWDLFIRGLWRYQYTRTEAPLTAALSEVLYELSSGLADMAVHLYTQAQIAVIRQGLQMGTSDEPLTVDVLRQVYATQIPPWRNQQ